MGVGVVWCLSQMTRQTVQKNAQEGNSEGETNNNGGARKQESWQQVLAVESSVRYKVWLPPWSHG